MWNKSGIASLALMAALLAGFAWLVLHPHEPVYEGKPLSFWLHQSFQDGDSGEQSGSKSQRALLAMGTDAFPLLKGMAGVRMSGWRIVWRNTFGAALAEMSRHPDFAFLHLPVMGPQEKQQAAFWGFKVLGSQAKAVVPAWARWLQRESFHDNPLNPVLWVAGMVMLVADLAALGWVSMWGALTTRSPNRITGITVARLLIAPWVLYLVIMGVGANVQQAYGWPKPTWKFFVGVWFGLGIGFDLAFGLTAWWQLQTGFRELALQHYAGPRSWVPRWLARRALAPPQALPASLPGQA